MQEEAQASQQQQLLRAGALSPSTKDAVLCLVNDLAHRAAGARGDGADSGKELHDGGLETPTTFQLLGPLPGQNDENHPPNVPSAADDSGAATLQALSTAPREEATQAQRPRRDRKKRAAPAEQEATQARGRKRAAPSREATAQYVCQQCGKTFALPGALRTHVGWHKRKQKQAAGVYDRKSAHLKEVHSVTDTQGKPATIEVASSAQHPLLPGLQVPHKRPKKEPDAAALAAPIDLNLWPQPVGPAFPAADRPPPFAEAPASATGEYQRLPALRYAPGTRPQLQCMLPRPEMML